MNTPPKSFYSINGCGTMLLDSSTINRTLGGPLAFLAMLLSIGWGIYIIFVKLKNEGKAYQNRSASPT
jgi:hypothetical protein